MTGRRSYARKVEIDRAIRAAQACGLDIRGVELSPDGHIRLIDREAIPQPQNDFDRYMARKAG